MIGGVKLQGERKGHREIMIPRFEFYVTVNVFKMNPIGSPPPNHAYNALLFRTTHIILFLPSFGE